jgi:uncharacterized membrane protein
MKNINILLAIGLLALPFLYLSFIYHSLPATVPTHFDLQGNADGFSEKSSLWMHLGLLSGIGLVVYGVLTNLSSFDPKQKGAPRSTSNIRKTAMAVVVLLVAMGCAIVYSTQPNALPANKVLFVVLGLFFLYLGNQMNSMKPNYFIGIRIPWTLDNEDNWRATHRIGSRSFMIGGTLMALCSIILPTTVSGTCFMVITALMTLIPVFYSFIYFKRHSKQPRS